MKEALKLDGQELHHMRRDSGAGLQREGPESGEEQRHEGKIEKAL